MTTIERTESWVQCECPPALCRHQPDGYRVVTEWGVWDDDDNFLGTFDTRREAVRFARDSCHPGESLNARPSLSGRTEGSDV